MSDNYLYLLLDLLAISIPLLASFYPPAPFYKEWRYTWLAWIFPAVIFILWDVLFTGWNVWGFNDQYLTGIYLMHLPMEEWLFFLCIPYSCLFTYFALEHLMRENPFSRAGRPISYIVVTGLAITGLLNLEKWYTSVTFIGLAVFLLIHLFYWKSAYLGKFYFTFILILIPFFLINGVLTGTGIAGEVVWYNNARNLGIRIGTIPLEDTFYGMMLLLMNVTIYERSRKNVK